MEIYAVIMAGGVGSRFWPRSKEKTPKQLLKIFGDNTMIQDTVNRLNGLVENENIYVITNKIQKPEIVNQININDCPLVVYTTEGLFDEFLPQLRAQLDELYFLQIPFDKQVRLYTARKSVARKPAILLETRIGDAFLLKGVDLTSMPWHPGHEVKLATYWTTLRSPDSAYKIFLQLRNDKNVPHFRA